MDTYPTLLSPIDNFSFSHFNSPSSNRDSNNKSNMSTPSGPSQFPHTPSPLKHSTEWQEILQGHSGGQFPFNYWDNTCFTQRQPSPSPWRPTVLRSLSDSYLDSPASSSLSLSSSATGSPAMFGTSATCSPWETCPGLQPSPDIPFLDELDLSGGLGNGFPSTLTFGTGDDTSAAFGGLSLNSPPTQPGSSLRSPILLPYEPFEQVDPSIIHDSGSIQTYSLLPPDVHSNSSTIEPSNLNLTNALALDFSDLPASTEQDPVTAQPHNVPFAPFGDPASTIQNIPTQSNSRSPPLSSFTDAVHIPPPPRSGSAPALTAGSSMDFLSFPPSAGFPSEGPLHSRSTRRKTSRVNYVEAFDGESDGDDEYVGEHSARDQHGRNIKRRRASGVASFTLSGSDSESGSSVSCDDLPRRGRKPGMAGRRAVSMSAASAKRKCKRRHSCVRPGCNATFTRVTDMERHVASVHREGDTDANRCSFCRKAFSREDAVLRHENDSCPMRPRKKAATPAERWS